MRHGARRAPCAAAASVALFALPVAAVALFALPAVGFIPSSEKLTNAAARANFEARRTGTLRLEVALFSEMPAEGVEAIARGEILSDPGNGRARLDLVGQNGVRERHVLGSGGGVWRDGERVRDARPLLPPVALLQFRYGRSLRGALSRLGVDLELADLGRSGDRDCFVVGGLDRAPGADGYARRASLWLDVYSYEIVRFDRSDGVRFRFGPLADFAGRRFPAWLVLEERDRSPLYLQVRSAAPGKATAADFRAPATP